MPDLTFPAEPTVRYDTLTETETLVPCTGVTACGHIWADFQIQECREHPEKIPACPDCRAALFGEAE